MKLIPADKDVFRSETIMAVEHGHPEKKQHGSFHAYTFHCASGKTIIISTAEGGINFERVV